ncbi:hypothetical protein R4P64_17930 [Rhodococcus sp. IEGM 1366]|nr:hypothetical protein [Rhodococcus sp. IEGM 1366]MDV8068397.1 hypothetical protein [Rhodococcus sp. IEGM 1366]
MTAEDVDQLSTEADRHGHGLLVLVLAYCGCRWSEAIALRVRDINFTRARLTVSDTEVQLGSKHYSGTTKGKTVR